MRFKTPLMAATLALAGVAGLAQAQTTAPSASKKELLNKLMVYVQPAVEGLSRQMTEQPARQMLQQAGQVLQRMPAERREAVARDVEADVRKYVEETTPLVRERALKLAPSTIGVLLDEKFSEDELRQILAILDSPVNKKFQGLLPEMQRSLGEKLVADSKTEVEGRLMALQATVAQRLGVAPGGAASAPKSAASKKK